MYENLVSKSDPEVLPYVGIGIPAFVAISRDGTGACWGQSWALCDDIDFSGITEVHSTSSAFLALDKELGIGTCWGKLEFITEDMGTATICSNVEFSGVTQVYSSGSAFLALNTEEGTGTCWGVEHLGGDCSGVDFRGVTEVYAGYEAFVALNRRAGTGTCWGAEESGGNCLGLDFSGQVDIYPVGDYSFFAFDEQTGRAFCWGQQLGCETVDLSFVKPALRCAPGSHAVADGTYWGSCSPCQAGHFSKDWHVSACDKCPAGKFQPKEGQSGCVARCLRGCAVR